MRAYIYISIILASVLLSFTNCSNYESLDENNAITTITDKADRYVKEAKLDSALNCYTTLIDVYSHELSDHDKETYIRIFNNAGYVYYIYLNDFFRASEYFEKAMSLIQETGNQTLKPYVLLNMSKIHYSCRDTTNALKLIQQAFENAVDNSDSLCAASAYVDLLSKQILNDSIPLDKSILKTWQTLNVSDTYPLKRFADHLTQIHICRINGNYEGAINIAMKSFEDLANVQNRDRYESITWMIICQIYLSKSNNEKALSALDSAYHAINHLNADIRIGILRKKSEVQRVIGRSNDALQSEYMALKLADSLMNSRDFGLIRNIEVSERLRNAEMELIKKQANFRYLIAILSCIVLILAISIIISVIIYRKNKRLREFSATVYKNFNQNLKEHNLARVKESDTQNNNEATLQRHNEVLKVVLDYMKNTPEVFDEDFSIATVAHATGIKQYSITAALNKVLRKNFGLVTAEIRVTEACRLLQNQDRTKTYTIESIAQKVGYSSRTHFSQIFKKITGLTPSEYMRAAQNES